METPRSKNSQDTFEIFVDSKIYYKAIVIKALWYYPRISETSGIK